MYPGKVPKPVNSNGILCCNSTDLAITNRLLQVPFQLFDYEHRLTDSSSPMSLIYVQLTKGFQKLLFRAT